jgi:hypothetical protein
MPHECPMPGPRASDARGLRGATQADDLSPRPDLVPARRHEEEIARLVHQDPMPDSLWHHEGVARRERHPLRLFVLVVQGDATEPETR